MVGIDRLTFINDHLFNEYRWLTMATVTWKARRDKGSPFSVVRHLDVLTLDSAALHARTLFDFFCDDKGTEGCARKDLGMKSPLNSSMYGTIKNELHGYLFHLNTGRLTNKSRPPIGSPHLKERVIDMFEEIRRLWVEFERLAPTDIAVALADARNRATMEGHEFAKVYGVAMV